VLETDAWTAALTQAPDRGRTLEGDEIDELLRAMADFVATSNVRVPGLLA
jgi:hypothetical protein